MTNTTNLIVLNDANFNEKVKEGITLVDFWAPWCGPCMMQTPILEKLAGKIKGKAKIAKLNVDENQSSAIAHNVSSIPTLILFKDGSPVSSAVGVQNEARLMNMINTVS